MRKPVFNKDVIQAKHCDANLEYVLAEVADGFSYLTSVPLTAKGVFSLVLGKSLSDLQVKQLKNKMKTKFDMLCHTEILNYIMILQYFDHKTVTALHHEFFE